MSDNPYERRRSKKSETGNRGRAAEAKTARRVKGYLTPASGAGGVKGDISTDDFLIENKSTVNASMSLKLSWLSKIAHEARGRAKRPALAIQFTDDAGKPVKDGGWVMVRESDFKEWGTGE